MTMRSISYGETEIGYTLVRRPGVTLSITVRPDRSVIVRAPTNAAEELVAKRVQRRARWIIKQQTELMRYEPRTPPRQFASGESHRYLGRQYLLKVTPNGSNEVRLNRPRIDLHLRGASSPAAAKRLLTRWYRTQAQRIFKERWIVCAEKLARYGVTPTGFSIRQMKCRWGSCRAQSRILLNPELVMAPVECIDYVILHELCHLRYPAHDWRFYRLLAKVCPNWAQVKRKLEAVAA